MTFAMIFAFVFAIGATEPASSNSRPPNFVVLFTDDLGYGDLGSYGHPTIRTPNLDALASEGQRWTDFYVAAPVCSPSRGALLTGALPIHTGLYGHKANVLFPNQPGGMVASHTTIAEVLQAQGYATAIIGKWHLGDRPENYPTRHGFDHWYGIPYSNDMDWSNDLGQAALFAPKIEYWNIPLVESRLIKGSKGINDGFEDQILERPAQQATLTERYTQNAVRFIEDHASTPFLLYLPYTMPHTPLFASPDFQGVSLAGRYGDVVEEIDWSAGQIRRALERAGVAENTLLIFTSDNGPWLTMRTHKGTAGPLKNGKGTTFEGGVRVPMIAWGPGMVKPGTVRSIGATLDLFHSFVVMAGVDTAGVDTEVPADSLDLSRTFEALTPSPRNVMPYYRGGELYALRKGPYKIHLVTQGAFGVGPERSEHTTPLLYHLGEDPGETYDLAGERPQELADMLAALETHRQSVHKVPSLFDLGKTPFGL